MGNYPLKDPRMDELLSADVGTIDELGALLLAVANQSRSMSLELTATEKGVHWMGHAYGQFKGTINGFTPRLAAVDNAYTQVARVVSEYADTVADVQPKFRQMASDLTAAESNYNTLQGNLEQDNDNLRRAQSAVHPDKDYIKKCQDAVNKDESDIKTCNENMTSLRAYGMKLLDAFSDARTAVNKEATAVGSQAPKESGWDKFLGDVDSVLKDIGGVVVGIADDIGAIPGDISTLLHHFSLKNLGKLAEDIGVAAGTVALALSLGGAALGAASEALGADAFADGAAVLSRGSSIFTALATDATGATVFTDLGQGEWKQALVTMALSKIDVDSVPGLATKSGVEAADDVAEATEAYSSAVQKALKAGEPSATAAGKAFSSLSEEQQELLNQAGSIPIDPNEIEQVAKQAAYNAEALKQTYDYVLDHGVKDPVKHVVAPEPKDS